jgi:DNA-binding Lrp family transcriptional regulator
MHKGFVLLNCDLGAEEFIVEELKKISQVSQAYVTFGAYDVIAEINADSQEAFDETVSLKIRRLTRIVSTMTLNVVNPQ